MNLNAFSHGQVKSKEWLCNYLEPHIAKNAKVAILGSWYNVLGFMMLTRQQDHYQEILGIDIDSSAIEIADKVCNAWIFNDQKKVTNVVADACEYDFSHYDVVINCSPEHMSKRTWFDNITSNTLVCLQTSNLDYTDDDWLIVDPTYTLEEFKSKYPLSQTIIEDTLDIDYQDWGYKRFMLIGIK